MKRSVILILLITLVFVSCKRKDVTPTYTVDELARDSLYNTMVLGYLWYDSMPAVVKDNYKNPYTLMDAMLYKPRDKWSFVQTYEQYLALYAGSFVGHGIRMGLDGTDQVRIAEVYNNSDLYSKGVRRGWIVKKLNGTELAPIFISGDGTAYSNLIGPSQAGVTNTFDFQTPQGKDSTITTTKSEFTVNTVLAADTFHLSTGITGYLAFDQFFPPANTELDTAFAFFQKSNIENLIVDLRYNGGGDLDILTNMASYIAGPTNAGSRFLRLKFNNKLDPYLVYTFNFLSKLHAITVSKIVFITTRNTASASEDLINGLKPYFNANLITIGDTTDGKPVGMMGIQYSNYYFFWPIMFKVINASGAGDFFSGIAPAKYVADDLTHDFGDRNEACVKEAVYYLENGSLSSKGAYIYRPSKQFTEGGRFNNAIIRNGTLELQK